VCGVGGLIAVDPAGRDYADGGFISLHHTGLRRRGMRAHQHRPVAGFVFIVHPQRSKAVPGGMPNGHVEHLEVIALPLHLRTFHHLETHADKDIADLFDGLGGQVQVARQVRITRQRDIRFIMFERLMQRLLQALLLFQATAFQGILKQVGP